LNPQPQSHPKLTPQVGKPETIALKRPGSIVGSRIAGAPNQAYYQLQDGRSMYLPLQVGQMIDQLKLQPGEPFTLLKRGPGSWDVRKLSAPPQTSPSAPVNGQGEDAGQILKRCYDRAIQIALEAVENAKRQGLMVTPSFEDIRCISSVLMISETGRR
jgi:hypothetical protein